MFSKEKWREYKFFLKKCETENENIWKYFLQNYTKKNTQRGVSLYIPPSLPSFCSPPLSLNPILLSRDDMIEARKEKAFEDVSGAVNSRKLRIKNFFCKWWGEKTLVFWSLKPKELKGRERLIWITEEQKCGHKRPKNR